MLKRTPLKFERFEPISQSIREYVIAIVLTALVTLVSWPMEPITGHAAVALFYLLLVVIAGLTLGRGPVLLVATSGALLWDYLFNPPHFAFFPLTLQDTILLATFIAVALAMGHLTSQLRLKEMMERKRERRTAALYELVQQGGLAPDLDSGLRAAIRLTETLFGVRAALLLRRADDTLAWETHPASSFSITEKEYGKARAAFGGRAPTDRATAVPSDSEAIHLPLQAGAITMGVLSILPPLGSTLDLSERELLEAFAVLIGTILQKERLLQGIKQAEMRVAAERVQLQRALLQSVSHELKTPLAAVQAGVDALRKQIGEDEPSQTAIPDTQKALRRLHRVINNLLDMTRIESGVVHAKLDWCDVGELIQAAIDLAADGVLANPIKVHLEANLPMVRLDQALLEQCLSNVLLNAASNSPIGTNIVVQARIAANRLIVSVHDEGKGIPESELPHIFKTFYRGAGARPGGTGLGLAIVDGFVRAHGGSVKAANKEPHGAEFEITIPVETLQPEILERLA
jgi:two-component system, OmpR family, sensor histidine kinase KdpD